MMWKSVIAVTILFGAYCNGQFVPGQQLNAHEKVDKEQHFRAFGRSGALYQQNTHLSGNNAGSFLPQEHVPLPVLRAPVHTVTVEQPQPVHPAPSVKTSRRQHVAAAKALETPRKSLIDDNAETEDEEERLLREQKEAQSAHYSFGSSIQDTINDHAIVRQETRDGVALKGMYSYSDGFYTRTVHYEADENGYRVVSEEIKPIGDGPKFNPKGTADISSSMHPSYSITADDFIRDTKTKKTVNELEKERQ